MQAVQQFDINQVHDNWVISALSIINSVVSVAVGLQVGQQATLYQQT